SRTLGSRRCRQPRILHQATGCTSSANGTRSITTSPTTTTISSTTSISTGTRLVALLGHPVAHSLSPQMQNAAFAARGLDWTYVALDVPPEQLEEAVHGLVASGYAGANVTIPHKRAAALLCDEADGEAVNTLLFDGGRIIGSNTDREIVSGID